jgi:hypothetical protein
VGPVHRNPRPVPNTILPIQLPASFGLIAVALLVLANGFFVATEFAIVAVRRSRLEQLATSGEAAARAGQEVVAISIPTLLPASSASRWPRWRSAASASPRFRT